MTKDESLKLALEALGASHFLIHGSETKGGLAYCMDGYYSGCFDIDSNDKQTNEAITAIKEALAQPEQDYPKDFIHALAFHTAMSDLEPEQEPVAYVKTVIEALYENSDPVSVEAAELLERITTSPPVAEPHKRKPLTDEKIERNWQFLYDEEGNPPDHHDFARAIEAEHGIKG